MILETQRLTLRRWTEADAESLYEYSMDPDVGSVVGWPQHMGFVESLEVICNVCNCAQCYVI